MAINVGKIGPRISPAATTSTHVNPDERLKAIPTVNTIHKRARAMTSSVSAPAGSKSAVISRDPVKVSQNTDSNVAAVASPTPLPVIRVVAQAATDASIGTWQKNAAQHSHTTGSESKMPRPPLTDSVCGLT